MDRLAGIPLHPGRGKDWQDPPRHRSRFQVEGFSSSIESQQWRLVQLRPGRGSGPRLQDLGGLQQAEESGAHSCTQDWVGDGGILPGLGQQAVVPVDVVGVEAQLALFDVLLDGVAVLILRRAGLREPVCLMCTPEESACQEVP